MAIASGAQTIQLADPLKLEFGGALQDVAIAYETWGKPSADRTNTIVLIPAFSAGSHAAATKSNHSPGWWDALIGPGRALDTNEFHVICPSILGSCYGTTGPSELNPATGQCWGPDFPIITVRDMVAAHGKLLDALGINEIHCVVGGSLGGMQSLQFAIQFPSRAAKAISISATDRTRPYTAAIRHLGRQAITSDPLWNGGRYGDEPPIHGLRLAREVGTLFYRSREEFNERFEWDPINTPVHGGIVFDVENYLAHQGKKVVQHFDANSYVALSMAMDLHDIGRGFPSIEAAVDGTQSEFLIAGVTEDRLIPCDEQRDLYGLLVLQGINARWEELSSPVGHDTFLVDMDLIAALLTPFLAQG